MEPFIIFLDSTVELLVIVKCSSDKLLKIGWCVACDNPRQLVHVKSLPSFIDVAIAQLVDTHYSSMAKLRTVLMH